MQKGMFEEEFAKLTSMLVYNIEVSRDEDDNIIIYNHFVSDYKADLTLKLFACVSELFVIKTKGRLSVIMARLCATREKSTSGKYENRKSVSFYNKIYYNCSDLTVGINHQRRISLE